MAFNKLSVNGDNGTDNEDDNTALRKVGKSRAMFSITGSPMLRLHLRPTQAELQGLGPRNTYF